MIDPLLPNHLDAIRQKCQQNKISKLCAFGSIVEGRFEYGQSDIDQVGSLLKMRMILQNLRGCIVDLISKSAINGKFFKKYLELYKELIFDKAIHLPAHP